ncbi:MAG TPA: DUF4396 domain-containing protein [Mycobacterium sp.]|nr:DUF4396 domain-containing protein [Mycobacterium sp.]HUH68111.1 DUF4396 domain-containing protein [Mycobacterium sp.]
MLDGVMLLWWILTIPSFLFVVIDIWRSTPESPVLKWAFVILTAFTGPLGAFFYVLGCREPLRGTHDEYIATRWRQVLGSTMHCVAGDGIGIVVAAAVGSGLALSFWPDFLFEYLLGFGFGWAFFQAFAMRDMAGGSYLASLKMTFLPELLSMNLLMTGMVLTSSFAMMSAGGGQMTMGAPTRPQFWFVMSMALIVGFVCAYPINWWLVANHLKHGMLTVRRKSEPAPMAGMAMGDTSGQMPEATSPPADRLSSGVKAAIAFLTFAVLGAALATVVPFAR